MRLWLFVLVAIVLVGGVADLRAETAPNQEEIKLRGWYLGMSGVNTWRDRYDVTGQTNALFDNVESKGGGIGLVFGHRFGDRFLFGLHLSNGLHKIKNSPVTLGDIEGLLTGTVLFREFHTWQPFLRGGFGGAIQFLKDEAVDGAVFSYGTAAVAGGGLQVRLSSRLSLELDLTTTFANFLEARDTTSGSTIPDEARQVRISQWGWRSGIGLALWF